MPSELIELYSEADTDPALARNFGDGAVDIDLWTIIFRMVRPDGVFIEKTITNVSNADGHITDGPAGDYQFTFLSTDLIEGRGQCATIVFQKGGGAEERQHLVFNVKKNLV